MEIPNSNRLSYRFMGSGDAELLFELDQDPLVMKFINGGKPSTMQDITKVMLPRLKQYRNPQQGWGLWQANATDSGQYLGWVLVRPMYFFSHNMQRDDLELGWRFFRHAWGQGYATEAAKTIATTLCQSNPKIKRLSAIAAEDNHGSIDVMKKLGMSYLKKDLHRDPLGDMEVVYYSKTV